MLVVGQVAELWRYPVKSMRGARLDGAMIGDYGVWGDRGWALRHAKTGRFLSAKQSDALMLCEASYLAEPTAESNPPVEMKLPDGQVLRSDSGEAPAALESLLGQPVMLDATPGLHFDAHPIHLLTTASLETLSRLKPDALFDVRRFRPNIVVKPAGEIKEGFVELGWLGRDLRIGKVDLLVKKSTRRCVMTTHPQGGLPKDPGVLQTVVDSAGANLGVYCAVLTGGRIAIGDSVVLL